MKTAAEILTVVRASQRDIENWIARLDLSTEFKETVRGRARLFSRENALELAFIATFVRGGASPSKAAVYAAHFTSDARRLDWERTMRRWFIFPSGDLTHGRGSNAVGDLSDLEEDLGTETLTTVNVWKIIKRVNALYEWAF
ncbi:hypothetical protein [Microvirga aerophila]|uniref:Uncharacterized protein n=1 Tax=Microvirga aerophila TaxID=670291 RepID=A0A512BVK5_9HYPH|nr:hypothetical protein [Microvirga aerophila]GEO16001.1 hypothetical protein MAE02_36970 [Microvirga aerophila]